MEPPPFTSKQAWENILLLHEYRCQYYEDDLHGALFATFQICKIHGLVVPLWCVYEISDLWDRYLKEEDLKIFENLNVKRPKKYRKGSTPKKRQVANAMESEIVFGEASYDEAADKVADQLHISDRSAKRLLAESRKESMAWSQAVGAFRRGEIDMKQLQRISAESGMRWASKQDFGKLETSHYSITRQTLLEVFRALYVLDRDVVGLPRFRREFKFTGPIHDFDSVHPKS